MASRNPRRTQADSSKPKPFLKPKPALNNKSTTRGPHYSRDPALNPSKKAAKVVVSTRDIFRKPLKQVYGTKSTHSRKHRRHEPENELFENYKEDMESYRATLHTDATKALAAKHDELTTRLSSIARRNSDLNAAARFHCKDLFSPLADERVETSIVRAGIAVSEERRIGDSIAELKALLRDKEADTLEAWKEWEVVQRGLRQLGREVLGEGDQGDDEGATGFKRQMMLWDAEKEAMGREIRGDIGEISKEVVKMVVDAEREIDARSKEQQASFFKKWFQDV